MDILGRDSPVWGPDLRHGLHHLDQAGLEVNPREQPELRGGPQQVPGVRQGGDHRRLDQGVLRQELGVRPKHHHGTADKKPVLHTAKRTQGE